MMTTERMKALPLSTDTACLLATMTLLQDLWDEVHKALENFYGSETRATEVMEKEFTPAYDKLEDFLQGYAMRSIRDRIYELRPTEI